MIDQIVISWFKSKNDAIPKRATVAWSQFCATFTKQPRRTPCTIDTCLSAGWRKETAAATSATSTSPTKNIECAHKNGKSWSPATYPAGSRRQKKSVDVVGVLVVDGDHWSEEILAATRERVCKFQYIIHASHSDRPANPNAPCTCGSEPGALHGTTCPARVDRCVRLIFVLSRPVKRDEWPRFWRGATKRLGLAADPSCCDANRIYYLPSRPSDADYFCAINDGEALDVDEILASAIETALDHAPSIAVDLQIGDGGVAVPGQRHAMLTSIAGALRFRGAGEQEILIALREANERRCQPPKPDDEVVAVARWAAEQPASPGASPSSLIASADGRYVIQHGEICASATTKEGEVYGIPLCNFVARVDEEIVADDGVTRTRVLAISGALAKGTQLARVQVRADVFADLNWITREWGVGAIVHAGRGVRDQVREAIEQFSSAARERVVYSHTGWRRVRDRWAFLHAGGAIGAEGVQVELDRLHNYRLPDTVEDLTGAIQLSATLLNAAPSAVAYPLLGVTYAAPLASILKADYTVFPVGPTGNLKTGLATISQQHFGTFSAQTLPASWISTPNAIEATIFAAKDVVCTIDDFKPALDPRISSLASRVITQIGNGAFRDRLLSDLSTAPQRPPRAQVLATGEQLPGVDGDSAQQRLIEVQVDRATLRYGSPDEPIDRLQAQAPRLPHSMRGYIEFLAPQYDELSISLPRRQLELRADLLRRIGPGVHLRTPDALAKLLVAIELFGAFAVEAGAFKQRTADRWFAEASAAFVELGKAKARSSADGAPVAMFMRVLSAMFAGHLAHLDPLDPRDRDHAEIGKYGSRRASRSQLVGWWAGDHAWLLPDLTLTTVADYLARSRTSWHETVTSFGELLVKAGARPGSEGRSQSRKRVPGVGIPRVWAIPLSLLGGGDEATEQQELPLALPSPNVLLPVPFEFAPDHEAAPP